MAKHPRRGVKSLITQTLAVINAQRYTLPEFAKLAGIPYATGWTIVSKSRKGETVNVSKATEELLRQFVTKHGALTKQSGLLDSIDTPAASNASTQREVRKSVMLLVKNWRDNDLPDEKLSESIEKVLNQYAAVVSSKADEQLAKVVKKLGLAEDQIKTLKAETRRGGDTAKEHSQLKEAHRQLDDQNIKIRANLSKTLSECEDVRDELNRANRIIDALLRAQEELL